MNEPDKTEDIIAHIPWFKQKIFLMILSSIVIALTLVMVAMALYASSGSAQLDASRPGLKAVRDKVQTEAFEGFPADGDVNKEMIDEFLELYDKQTGKVDGDSMFSPHALTDEALGIEAP